MLIEKDYTDLMKMHETLLNNHTWYNESVAKNELKALLKNLENMMSYDVKIGSFETNHTYNGAAEIKELAGFEINNFNGLPGCVVYGMVDDLLKIVIKNRSKLETKLLQKYNGWGTYDSWVNFLTDIKNGCKKNQFADVIIE